MVSISPSELSKSLGQPYKLSTGNTTITTEYFYPPTILLFLDSPTPSAGATIDLGTISIISVIVYERRNA